MNTFMARLWMFGGFAGLAYGTYLAVEKNAGVTAMAIMPLIGATGGVLIAMAWAEFRQRVKKKAKK